MKNNITRALSVIMSIIICISFTIGSNAVAIAETISGDASSDASSNAVPMVTDINNDVFTFKDKDAGVKVLVAKKDSWDEGYVADISIENTGSEALSNWHIGLKVKGDIDSVWNSEYEVKDGKLTLSYPAWKRKINAGETYTVGMKVNGTFGDFEEFSYYEDAKDVSELYKIEYKVRNTWSRHAVIDAVITNTGETTLRDWSVIMDYDADIVDIWNADVVSNEGGSYRLKCKDYNADIKPDESVTFGFQAQYEGDEVILPTKSKLYAVADSKLVPTKTDKADWYKVMTNADSDEAIRMRDSVKDRVKVAIIDSGVDYMGEGDEINRVDFIGDTDEENPLYDDRSGHGTGVAGMLLGASEEDETEEEETTEAPVSDMDFSYLTDADYIEAVDVEDEEDLDEDNEEDYDDEDYDDIDDEEENVDEFDDNDIDDEEIEENDAIDDEDELEDEDSDYEEDDFDDDLNLFEYNELYGDIEGLNPNIDLTSLRVLDEDNEAPVSRVIEAIEWAIDNDINILNLSWGIDTDNTKLHNVIKRAYNKGMLIIAAAGNDGEISYPAKYDEVIAVGSVDGMGKIAASSASGDGIELVAPAEDVIAYTSFGILTFVSGTSYAAPQITALASILWQQDITVSNKCIRELLRQSASPLGDSDCYGYGMADYKKAAGMYEEFVKGYEDNTEVETVAEDNVISSDADDVEADEVNVVDEEFVKGLWENHHKILKKNTQIAKIAKAALLWVDNTASGVSGMTQHPQIHGKDGSVDSYITMMNFAKELYSDDWDYEEYDLSDGVYKDVKKAVDTYRKSGKKINGKVNNSKNVRNKIILSKKMSKSQREYTAYFVMGIALHTLGDYYAHNRYGLIEKRKYYFGKGSNYDGDIPNTYAYLTHEMGGKDKNTGKYIDARTDCPSIAPKRYKYTKYIYNYVFKTKFNDEYMSSEDGWTDESDFVCFEDDDCFEKYTESENLNARINDINNHFAIPEFGYDTSLYASDAVECIDMDEVLDHYSDWKLIRLKFELDDKMADIKNLKVVRSVNDKKINVVNSRDKSSYKVVKDKKGMYITYSFIGNVDTDYIIYADSYNKKGKCTSITKVVTSGSESSARGYNNKRTRIHYCYKKGTYKCLHKGYYLFGTQEINITSKNVTKSKVEGGVVGINCQAVSDAQIMLKGVSNQVACHVFSDSAGRFAFDDEYRLSPGIYDYMVTKAGYKTAKGTIRVINAECNTVPMITLVPDSDMLSSVQGTVRDATNNSIISGLFVELYEGHGISYDGLDKPIASTYLDKDGKYKINNVPAGYYTAVITDKRNVLEVDRYRTGIIQMVLYGNSNSYDGYISKNLNDNQIRTVLEWGVNPKDLDAHLYANLSSGASFHCYYANSVIERQGGIVAKLDVDNTQGNGHETLTLYNPEEGRYRYSVVNYSKGSLGALSASNAQVQVYLGDTNTTYNFYVPKGNGYTWDVFEYNEKTHKFTLVNKIY